MKEVEELSTLISETKTKSSHLNEILLPARGRARSSESSKGQRRADTQLALSARQSGRRQGSHFLGVVRGGLILPAPTASSLVPPEGSIPLWKTAIWEGGRL